MPKFDLVLKPGDEIPEEFSQLLKARLSSAQLLKLLKHGGLIRLSIASPYVERKDRSETVEINQAFLDRLKTLRNDEELLRKELATLRVAQLKDVCKLLGKPVRSEASSREIRSQIVHSLKAADMWEGISASKPDEPQSPD